MNDTNHDLSEDVLERVKVLFREIYDLKGPDPRPQDVIQAQVIRGLSVDPDGDTLTEAALAVQLDMCDEIAEAMSRGYPRHIIHTTYHHTPVTRVPDTVVSQTNAISVLQIAGLYTDYRSAAIAICDNTDLTTDLNIATAKILLEKILSLSPGFVEDMATSLWVNTTARRKSYPVS